MFRYVTTILLLTAFAAQTFQQVVIVLDYYTNTSSFAKICANKAKPILQCYGKCQMRKKIQEEEKKDQQMPERKGENKSEIVYFTSFLITLQGTGFNAFKASPSIFLPIPLQDRSLSIFHPPAIV